MAQIIGDALTITNTVTVGQIIAALSAAGIQLKDDGGNLGISIADGGYVGIGVASPFGPLQGYDGAGGFVFVTKTGINGTPQTIIPSTPSGAAIGASIFGLAHDGVSRYNLAGTPVGTSSSVTIGDGGVPSQLQFAISGAGELTAVRSSGSRTWKLSVFVVWM